MKPSFFILFLLASSLVFLPSVSLSAQEKPEVKLVDTIEALIDVMFQGEEVSLETKKQEIREVLNRSFSFEVIIRRAVGRNWKKLSPGEQTQVTEMITQLIVRAYTTEFKAEQRPILSYGEPLEIAKNKIEVSSELTINGTPIYLTYRMAKLKSGWQVYDVLVEGVSLVSNYRKQFDAHFQKQGGAELIAILEDKLKES